MGAIALYLVLVHESDGTHPGAAQGHRLLWPYELPTYCTSYVLTHYRRLPTDPLSQAGKARVPGKGSSASNLSLQRQAAAQPNSSSELRSLDKMIR